MRKLSLNLDQLTVDSFDTSAPATEQGTVFGEQCTCWTNCTCPGCPTCDNTACGQNTCGHTCGNTCGASCYGTCGGYTCANTCGDTCGWGCGQTAQYTHCGDIICY